MSVVTLSPLDLSLAAGLVVLVALLSYFLRLRLERQIIIAAARTTVQLMLVGLVLKALFSHVHLGWIVVVASIMLLAAGREVLVRQKRRFAGLWGFGLGTFSMFISSFTITILTLTVLIGPVPWYEPQYAVPLLGMLLGNTMNGIAIGLDRLTSSAWDQRA
ncbi:MAG: ABC transporter permease, partial [Desulfatitalea sp.]|nr:ABC transporter permease [Desulfatitalea sp.]